MGGGITGAGIARDAALRGLSVALIEQDDFAGGTSSRSSRLIHGGVRYLEHGHLKLVFEASRERRILLRTAPHLVRPLQFTWPVYRGARIPRWQLRAGLGLYDALALFGNVGRHRGLSSSGVLAAEPATCRVTVKPRKGGADAEYTTVAMSPGPEGTTLVVVEQDVSQVVAVAQRVYCLRKGVITLDGIPADLDRAQIAAAYFGS